jgi:multidrug efflux pump subunit AcrB/ABC-type multidrug transport system ATPase subunit
MGICFCLGSAALVKMPISYLLGDREAPLWVSIRAPSAPGREVVLNQLLIPFEAQLKSLDEVAEFTAWVSTSSAGILVEPGAGFDRTEVADRVREIAEVVASGGPARTTARVFRARPMSERPGLVVQISGVSRASVENELLPELRQVRGLRTVELFPPESYVLELSVSDTAPETRASIRSAIQIASQSRYLGNWRGLPVVSAAAPQTVAAVLEVPVSIKEQIVPAGELATPSIRQPEVGVHFRVNGHEGLFLIVHDDASLPRRDALARAESVVKQWADGHPGASVTVLLNLWSDVVEALKSLAIAGLIGLLLALMALWLALRQVRATLLMATSVPLSLALALVLIGVAGEGLDIIALGALAIALGLLVDASVVVGESLAARREATPLDRAVEGVRAAIAPLAIAGLTTVAAIAPVWLGTGPEYEVMQAATLPLAAAIVASIVVASLVIPGLAGALRRMPGMLRLRQASRLVKASVRDPLVSIGAVLAPAVLVVFVFHPRGGVLISEGDPRDLRLRITTAVGAGPAVLGEALAGIEGRISRVDGVEYVFSQVSRETASLWLRLDKRHSTGGRRQETVRGVLRQLGTSRHYRAFRWETEVVKGASRGEEAPDSEYVGRLGVRVSGQDPRALDEAMSIIRTSIGEGVPGRRTSRRLLLTPRVPGTDLVNELVLPDAERFPVDLRLGEDPVRVEVRSQNQPRPNDRLSLDQWMTTPGVRGSTPAQLASHRWIEESVWPVRENGTFVKSADLRIARHEMSLEGLEQERAKLHKRLRRLPLPPGVSMVLDPLGIEDELPPWLLPGSLAILLLFIVLGVGFESLIAPLRVMAAIVPHLAGAMLTAWFLMVEINEAAVFGALLLLGVAVNAGVLLEDRFFKLRRSGVRQRQAVVRAGIERAPTVLLTAATSLAALAPLWLAGIDQLGRPFVAVLGGGLLFGTPLTLLLVPAMQALGSPALKPRRILWNGDGRDHVSIRSISKSYKGKVRALYDVTTELEPGLVGLLGPNGAGKTTLIRCLVGAIRADTGDVWVNNVRRSEDPVGWRRLVGYLPQSQVVPLRVEAGKWLELWAGELGLDDVPGTVHEALRSLGVEDLARSRLEEMSGGQRRRVRIARALLGQPAILVVDEPTTGLDPEARVELRNLLGLLARERLVLLSTHIPEDVAIACRRVLVLDRGRLCFDGAVSELLRRANGRVRRHLVNEAEMRYIAQNRRIVSRVREISGLRIRYLSPESDDPGEIVEPTMEEAYLWLISRNKD